MPRNSPHRIIELVAAISTACVILVGFAAPTTAGGWAVGSIDEVPESTAGDTAEVGFTILQHGVTPVELADDVGIEIVSDDGATTYFAAEPDETIGHYTASVTFPNAAGEYDWNIRMGWFGDQGLGTLTVGSGNDSTSAATTIWATGRWIMLAIAAALAAVALSSLATRQRKTVVPS